MSQPFHFPVYSQRLVEPDLFFRGRRVSHWMPRLVAAFLLVFQRDLWISLFMMRARARRD